MKVPLREMPVPGCRK